MFKTSFASFFKCLVLMTIIVPTTMFFSVGKANSLTVSQPVLSVMLLPKLSNGYIPVSVSAFNSSISSGELFPFPNFPTIPENLQALPPNLDAYLRTYTKNGSYASASDNPSFNAIAIEAVYTQNQPSLNDLIQNFLISIGRVGSGVAMLPEAISGVCSSCERKFSYVVKEPKSSELIYFRVAAFSVNGVDYFLVGESVTGYITAKIFSQIVLNQKSFAINSGLPKVSVTITQPVSGNKAIIVIALVVLLALVIGYFWYRAAAKKSAEISKQMAYKFRSG